jgi:hypothetical protein
LDIVPILYGLPPSDVRYLNVDVVGLLHNLWERLKHRETYYEAVKRFPESNSIVGGGCMVGYETKAEVLYCQSCRAIELKWRKRHPNRGPEIVAVISSGRGS